MRNPKYNKETLRPFVRVGAKFLDERRVGWADEIDLARFEMHQCARCVLGQLFRLGGDGYFHGYERGLGILQLDLQEAKNYGFTLLIGDDLFGPERERGWNNLKALWVEEITKRTT